MRRAPIVITTLQTLPAANNFTFVLDSTRRAISAISSGSARLAPGSYRHAWAGGRVRGTIKNGDQAITCNLLLLTNSQGTTNAAWEVDTTAMLAGTFTIAASTTVVIDWLPRSPDFAVELQMGGTATSAVTPTMRVEFDPSPAV